MSFSGIWQRGAQRWATTLIRVKDEMAGLYTRLLGTRQGASGCSFHAWQPICSDYLKTPQFTFLPSLTISHVHSFREQEPSHSAETTNHMPRMYTTPIPSSRATVSPKNGDATDPNTSPLASTRHVRTSYVASHAMTSLVPPT